MLEMISHLDHLVLTVTNISTTVDFYTRVLGMREVNFGNGRTALTFGKQKINLHLKGHEFEPKAQSPLPGSADLCFLCDCSMDSILAHLHEQGISPEEGPEERTGATSPILSVYLRDPDGNLIEISTSLQRA